MKKIPIYPRKDYVIKSAMEFIIKSGIRSLPVDLFKLYKKYGWAILSTDGRILWTIAHEIGHIVLKHMEGFEQTEIHKGLQKKKTGCLKPKPIFLCRSCLLRQKCCCTAIAPARVLL